MFRRRGPAEVVESRSLEEPEAGRRAGEAGSPYHLLVLRAPEIAVQVRPGQFAHIACPAGPEPFPSGSGAPAAKPAAVRRPGPGVPFLRRPLSFHDADPEAGTVTLLFQVVGPGTGFLAGARPGDCLDIIGPLGEGVFPLDPGGPVVLVGGGVGVAPMLLLARRLLAAPSPPPGPVRVLIGVPGSGHLGLAEPFRRLGDGVRALVASEECGVPGTSPGLVTDLLARVLEDCGSAGEQRDRGRHDRPGGRPVVYACGPWPMLLEIWRLVDRAGLAAWISTGEHMACGVGACRGCAIPVAGRTAGRPGSRAGGRAGDPAAGASGSAPYRRACRDGPVFEARELDWERIAAIYAEGGAAP